MVVLLLVVWVKMYRSLLSDVVKRMLLWCLSGSFTQTRLLRMLPSFYLCFSAGEMPLRSCASAGLCWDQAVTVSNGVLSRLLHVGILLSVTRNLSALQSCHLSRLKGRNFFPGSEQAAHKLFSSCFCRTGAA